MRVLLVDDDADLRFYLRHELEVLRCEITEARNGAEAVCHFLENEPDVILSDIEMPEMNGLRLLTWVKRRYPSARVVLMTGNDRYLDDLALAAEADAILRKPFSRAQLTDALLTKLDWR